MSAAVVEPLTSRAPQPDTSTPPHDLEAEAAVLNGILHGGPIPRDLTPLDFYLDAHRHLFAAVLKLAEDGDGIDEPAIYRKLREAKIEKSVPASMLASLTDGMGVADVEGHAQVVRQHAAARRARELGLKLAGGAKVDTILPELEALARPRGDGGLVAVELTDFLAMELPEGVKLLGDWLHEQDLIEVHAYRGVGKTYFSLGITVAVAAGAPFLGWAQGEQPAGVLYLDGELPGRVLQERLVRMVQAVGKPIAPLLVVTPDMQPAGMTSLLEPAAQASVERLLDDEPRVRLVIIDNLSTLCGGAENETADWQPMQEFILRLRRRGLAVLFVHHSGKTGLQRGTSKREDVLDWVFKLSLPSDYRQSEGCRFEVTIEKHRHMTSDLRPIEASLITDQGGLPTWSIKSMEDSRTCQVAKLARDGFSQKEIADELGINKSNVSRAIKRAREQGLLEDSGGTP